MNGLNLVATWSEPFSLEGEELSYEISVTNLDSRIRNEEIFVSTASYTLTKHDDERDCAEYEFTVFSKNGYSKSSNAVSGREHFPAGDNNLSYAYNTKFLKRSEVCNKLIVTYYGLSMISS